MYPLILPLQQFIHASPQMVQTRFFSFGKRLQRQLKYGQPTEWTHPHIIKKNEINRGILKSEFKNRREKLIEKLLEVRKEQKHLLLLPAAKKKFMVDNIPYFYRKVRS